MTGVWILGLELLYSNKLALTKWRAGGWWLASQ